MLESLLFCIGLSFISRYIFLFVSFIRSQIGSSMHLELKGSWAVITACTDGIGLGFSQVLASQGINIVQIGRNPAKLESVASDLRSKYGVQVKSIVKDFSHCPKNPIKFFTEIFEECSNLDISLLVNNVGAGQPLMFKDLSHESVIYTAALTLWPIVFMSRLFLPKLEQRNNGQSYIINLSSTFASYPTVRGCLYSAGKAFDKEISIISSNEGKTNVLCLQPGLVDTTMTIPMKYKVLMINTETCAKDALKSLGRLRATYGNWKHWVSYFTMDLGQEIVKYTIAYAFN
jgi:17beta-estradiol 17-dehydrogenase / very-long-chain 3-oxoacyl-CoA reductase